MGFPITRNIARAGMPVRGWNRSRDKAKPLAEEGAYIADAVAQRLAGGAREHGEKDFSATYLTSTPTRR